METYCHFGTLKIQTIDLPVHLCSVRDRRLCDYIKLSHDRQETTVSRRCLFRESKTALDFFSKNVLIVLLVAFMFMIVKHVG